MAMVVPIRGGEAKRPASADLPDSALLMAAATMHQMGRLGPMRPSNEGMPLFDPKNMPKKDPNVKEEPRPDPVETIGIRG